MIRHFCYFITIKDFAKRWMEVFHSKLNFAKLSWLIPRIDNLYFFQLAVSVSMSQTLGWNISVGSHVSPDFKTAWGRPVFLMRLKTEDPCVIMIVWSTVCAGEDQRKHQSFASLAFVRRIHRTGGIKSNGTRWEGIQVHTVLATFNSEESCLLAHISLW